MTNVTWVLESEVFPESHPSIREAIKRAGHVIVDWSEDWIEQGPPARLSVGPTIFHGSLGNAALVHDCFDWNPGSFCDVEKFRCSSWYDHQRRWLLHEEYTFTTVEKLLKRPREIADSIGGGDQLFVRPDSPLKPFSGRIVGARKVTASNLDLGFYYDDPELPIVVAPIRTIGREWRFVVVDGVVVAGSGYEPSTRQAISVELTDKARQFAAMIATESEAWCDVYVMDVCQCEGDIRLVEFNPFGGADLYACNPDSVVDAVSTYTCRP